MYSGSVKVKLKIFKTVERLYLSPVAFTISAVVAGVNAVARATAIPTNNIAVVFTGSVRVVVTKLAYVLDNDDHGRSEKEKG